MAALSPIAKDYTKPDNQFGAEMAEQSVWVRSKHATGMLPLLGERMAECAARDVSAPFTHTLYPLDPVSI